MRESRLRDPHHLEIVQEVGRRRIAAPESFDRAAFAWRALGILQPPKWTVALYLREGDFHVDWGRDLGAGTDAVWAMVGIPRGASRGEIAMVLAELTGARNVPFIVDLLASEKVSAA